MLEKLDSYMEKTERTHPNIIHKNKLKMDWKPKYNTRLLTAAAADAKLLTRESKNKQTNKWGGA